MMSERRRQRDNLRRAREAIKQERENPKMDKKTLAYLLSEHSMLWDDFRSLNTTQQREKDRVLQPADGLQEPQDGDLQCLHKPPACNQ